MTIDESGNTCYSYWKVIHYEEITESYLKSEYEIENPSKRKTEQKRYGPLHPPTRRKSTKHIIINEEKYKSEFFRSPYTRKVTNPLGYGLDHGNTTSGFKITPQATCETPQTPQTPQTPITHQSQTGSSSKEECGEQGTREEYFRGEDFGEFRDLASFDYGVCVTGTFSECGRRSSPNNEVMNNVSTTSPTVNAQSNRKLPLSNKHKRPSQMNIASPRNWDLLAPRKISMDDMFCGGIRNPRTESVSELSERFPPVYVPVVICITTKIPYTQPIQELFSAFCNLLNPQLVETGTNNGTKLYWQAEFMCQLIFTLSIQRPIPFTTMNLNVHGNNISIHEGLLSEIPNCHDTSVSVYIYIYIYLGTIFHTRRKNNSNTMGFSYARKKSTPLCRFRF